MNTEKLTKKLLKKAVAGTITDEEKAILTARAAGWHFCAVGENRSAFHRIRGLLFDKSSYSPIDSGRLGGTVYRAGHHFYSLVNMGLFHDAQKLYNRLTRMSHYVPGTRAHATRKGKGI